MPHPVQCELWFGIFKCCTWKIEKAKKMNYSLKLFSINAIASLQSQSIDVLHQLYDSLLFVVLRCPLRSCAWWQWFKSAKMMPFWSNSPILVCTRARQLLNDSFWTKVKSIPFHSDSFVVHFIRSNNGVVVFLTLANDFASNTSTPVRSAYPYDKICDRQSPGPKCVESLRTIFDGQVELNVKGDA